MASSFSKTEDKYLYHRLMLTVKVVLTWVLTVAEKAYEEG